MIRRAAPPPGPNDRVLRLPDGRLLGYAEYGDPAGEALFFFHGSPGSRLSGAFLDSAAKQRGLRVVALERPGFGLSDFQPGRTIGSWPAAVREAARHLGIDGLSVLGFSAGGPYALACAAALGEQVAAVGVVSSAGLPSSRESSRFRSSTSASLAGLLVLRAPGWYLRRLVKHAAPADRAALARPEVRAALLKGDREAFRHGSRGVVDEMVLLARPWGIEFDTISSRVVLWHGEEDRTVPVHEARALAANLPGGTTTVIPGAGHFWLLEHGGEVLDALFVALP